MTTDARTSRNPPSIGCDKARGYAHAHMPLALPAPDSGVDGSGERCPGTRSRWPGLPTGVARGSHAVGGEARVDDVPICPVSMVIGPPPDRSPVNGIRGAS